MGSKPLALRPGVDTQSSPMLLQGGFVKSQLVRFQQAKLQKGGGWLNLIATAVVGTARALLAWDDLAGNRYLAIGTNERLQLYFSGALYDITPLQDTRNVAGPFTTVNGQSLVTVTDVAHGLTEGQWIRVLTAATINGLFIQGFYKVTAIVDADNYKIDVGMLATGSSTGGATALFTTTNMSNIVTVTLPGHNLQVGYLYTVYVSTTVATVIILGTYVVNTVIDANNFTIVANSAANAGANGHENGNQVRIYELLAPGPKDASTIPGYGDGPYSYGPYGIGSIGEALTPLRQWFLNAWGQQLIAQYTRGPFFVWDPTAGVDDNQATQIGGSAPTNTVASFIAMPQQQLVALATDVMGTPDPLLVRFSDIADYTNFIATASNQAGSFRLTRGSRIVGGTQGPQFGMIWTDLGLWLMQYVQPPFVYGFKEIAQGCGLIAARAWGVLNTRVKWMGQKGFFNYDGGVTPMICTVWDKVFGNLDSEQADKITGAPNSAFNEMTWFYARGDGNGEVDSYVTQQEIDNVWTYGLLSRTAWTDVSTYGMPLGVDEAGIIQQHEISNDANGMPLNAWVETGFFYLAEGEIFTFLNRILPDFVFSVGGSTPATILITVYMVDFPKDTPRVFGPFTVTQATKFLKVNGRGRLCAFRIESNDLGSFWRLGSPKLIGSPAGMR